MKKLIVLAAAASAAAIATPAAAQSASGTVDVSGTVGAKCTASDPISGSIPLGELAKADGTIDGAFPNNTAGLSRSFTLRCTSNKVKITVSSDQLKNTAVGQATAENGYTGIIDYTSTLVATGVSTSATATYNTVGLGAAATATLSERLANSTNNVTVTVSDGTTAAPSDLLKEGSYSSTIAIKVEPTV